MFATKFGKPLPGAHVDTFNTHVGNRSTDEQRNGLKLGFPPLVIMNKMIKTDHKGIANIRLGTVDHKNQRKIIDGQLYSYIYVIKGSEQEKAEASNETATYTYRIMARVFNNYTYNRPITWVDHIYPIFKQYSYLFPVMRTRAFDMGNYFDVVAHKKIMTASLQLPKTHSSYMPVTRDLSNLKRKMILEWLNQETPLFGDPIKLLTLPYLKELLQTAIEFEHATLPTYQTAYWSLKDGYNTKIRKMFNHIIQLKRVHVMLLGNLISALGRVPSFKHKTFHLNYPSLLPGGIISKVVIPMQKMSLELIRDVLMKLEQPEQSTNHVKFQETIFSHMSMLYQNKCKQVDGSLHCRHEAKGSESENSPYASIQNRKECERFIDIFLKSTVKHFERKGQNGPYVDPNDRRIFSYDSSSSAFYNHILLAIAKLTQCGKNSTIFTTKPGNQLKGLFGPGQVFEVTDYFSAVKAIQKIIQDKHGRTSRSFVNDRENEPESQSIYSMLKSIRDEHAEEMNGIEKQSQFSHETEEKTFHKKASNREKEEREQEKEETLGEKVK